MYPAPKDKNSLLLEKVKLKDVEKKLLADLHGNQAQLVQLTQRRRDDIFQSLELIEGLMDSVKSDTATEILHGIREAVDGVTNTLERHSAHTQLAFNQYKSTMDRLSSLTTSLSYREQNEIACKATKTIMEDCEARLIQASNMYSTMLAEKDCTLALARVQCQAFKRQADFLLGAKLAYEEQLRNLREAIERESYLKDLAVKENLEMRATLTKSDNKVTKSVGDAESATVTLCSGSETRASTPEEMTRTEESGLRNEIAAMASVIRAKEAKITAMAKDYGQAAEKILDAKREIKELRAQLAIELARARTVRPATKGALQLTSSDDPLLSSVTLHTPVSFQPNVLTEAQRAIEGWAKSQEALALRVVQLNKALGAPLIDLDVLGQPAGPPERPALDRVENGRLAPAPPPPSTAGAASVGSDVSHASHASLIAAAAADCEAVREAAAGGDHAAFKSHFGAPSASWTGPGARWSATCAACWSRAGASAPAPAPPTASSSAAAAAAAAGPEPARARAGARSRRRAGGTRVAAG